MRPGQEAAIKSVLDGHDTLAIMPTGWGKSMIWGEGLVLRYEGDKMVVLFDSVGYKTLVVDIVTERKLLAEVTG